VKSRFNRAVFETPLSGNLPPLTLPVYEPLIDPDKVAAAEATILARQSFLAMSCPDCGRDAHY